MFKCGETVVHNSTQSKHTLVLIALATQMLQHFMSFFTSSQNLSNKWLFVEFMKLSTKLSPSFFFSTAFPFHCSSVFPFCLNIYTFMSFIVYFLLFLHSFPFTHEKSLAVSVVCVLTLLPALPEESLFQTRSVSRTPGLWSGRLPSPTDPPCSAGSNLHSTYWAPVHHEPGQKHKNTQLLERHLVQGFLVSPKSLFHKKVLNWSRVQTSKCP